MSEGSARDHRPAAASSSAGAGLSRGSLPTLLGIVFIDMLGFAMIIPLIPFYAERFGASATVVGILVASYAMAQLVGAPILGSLSDRIGRKPVLMASLIGTSIGFLLFGLAGSLWLLFVARSLDGLTGGNVSVAQAYIADVSAPEKRARNFGFVGAAFGIGFILGPALGGFLSRFGLSTPAFFAAGLAALNVVAVIIFLPESLPSRGADDEGSESNQPRHPSVGEVVSEGHAPPDLTPLDEAQGWGHLRAGDRAGGLLWTRFWYMLAFVTYALIFALWAQYHLGVDAETAGYLLAYVGVLILIVQGGLVGWVSKHFREGPVLLTCIALLAVSLAAWSQVDSIPALLIVQIPLSVAAGLFGATMNSALSQAVPAHEVGSVLGIGTSLESVTRALSPTMGGILLDRAGPWAPGAFGAAVLILLLPFAARALKRKRPGGDSAGAF